MLALELLVSLVLLASPETERMLLGPSPFFRYEAVRRALRDEDEALLLKATHSEHWDARRLAAEALGKKAPVMLLEDKVPAVRTAALKALGTLAPKERVLELLSDSDDAVRAAAAWSLLGRRRGASRALRPLRKDPSVSVRMAAIAVTGDFAALRKIAVKADPGTAAAALRALGRAGQASEGSFLVSRLSRVVKERAKEKTLLYYEASPHTHFALARAVGDLARRNVTVNGKSVPVLLRKMSGSAQLGGSAGVLLAEAAAGARDAELARRIVDAQLNARSKSPLPDRFFAPALAGVLNAFAREDWPALAPMLLPVLEHRDPFVRIAVVSALHGDTALPALRDPFPAVRAAACMKVRRLASLAAMAGDRDATVAAACARALGRRGDPASAGALGKLAGHADPRVRRAAAAALLRVPAKDRLDRLYRLATRDAAADVRATAGAALAILEDPAVMRIALIDLEHDDPEVRRRTIALIHRLTRARNGYDPKEPEAGALRWRDWFAHKKGRLHADDAFRYHVEDLRRRGIDLVLVIDATGSMTPVLQATKRRIAAVVHALRRIVPNLRLRAVAFRDRTDAFLTLGSPLSPDPRVLEDFLAGIPATGGGDTPEGVLAGLRQAIERTAWRPNSKRVVLLFGDAPPHENEISLVKAIVGEFKGTVHTVDVTGYPYARSNRVRVPLFKDIAGWGNGTAVRLADEQDLLRQLLLLTLGPKHRASVEALYGY